MEGNLVNNGLKLWKNTEVRMKRERKNALQFLVSAVEATLL